MRSGPRYTVRDAQAIAQKFGGLFLDKELKGTKHRHRWQSREGIIFTRTLQSILATRTFQPDDRTMELVCRCVFQGMFDECFPKVKPLFLITDDGIRRELDGYSEKLGVAFKYQGIQHYQHVPYFHTKEQFHDLQRVDALKRGLCEARGIHLIAVPYSADSIEAIRELVLTYCRKSDIEVKNPRVEISYQSITRLQELQRRAEQHGQMAILGISPSSTLPSSKMPLS